MGTIPARMMENAQIGIYVQKQNKYISLSHSINALGRNTFSTEWQPLPQPRNVSHSTKRFRAILHLHFL